MTRDEKFVLIAILEHMHGRKTTSFPSEPIIVSMTGISLSQVKRAIKSLEASGWLQVVRPGPGRANIYTITPVDSMIRHDDEVKASARQSSQDAKTNLVSWRVSKGLPVAEPDVALSPEATTILGMSRIL